MSKHARGRSCMIIFLLGVSPLVSLFYLIYAQDSLLGIDRDFGVFWTAGNLAGENAVQIFDPTLFRQTLFNLLGARAQDLPFLYPPHSLFYFLPLSLGEPVTALICWLGATFAIMAFLLKSHLAPWQIYLPALLLSPASIVNITCGQNAYLSTGLLIGGLLLMERRPVLAGILLGLLSYKPQLGLIIPFVLIADRYWQSFIAATVTTLALISASLFIFGWESWYRYLHTIIHQLDFVQQWGFTSYSFYMAFDLYGLEWWQAGLLHAILGLFVIAAVCWSMRQNIPREMKMAIATLGAILVAPYFLPYDMVLISAALLITVPNFLFNTWEKILFALIWILPAFAFLPETPIGPMLIGISFLILLRHVQRLSHQLATTLPAQLGEQGNQV